MRNSDNDRLRLAHFGRDIICRVRAVSRASRLPIRPRLHSRVGAGHLQAAGPCCLDLPASKMVLPLVVGGLSTTVAAVLILAFRPLLVTTGT